ncbi:hypothetical protein AB2T90_11145 [Clostridium butyricum]|uniref:hypothetical protein n=1 Tax=Clostridium butyricum TaxID=1492 RepID=UPI0034665711
MSRNSMSINVLKESMNSISGLDGQVGYITESLIPIIKAIENGNNIPYKSLKKFEKECKRYNSI